MERWPARYRITIFDLCHKMNNNIPLTTEEMRLALKNGAFPKKAIEKWTALLAES